jgi:hypothetical protein
MCPVGADYQPVTGRRTEPTQPRGYDPTPALRMRRVMGLQRVLLRLLIGADVIGGVLAPPEPRTY